MDNCICNNTGHFILVKQSMTDFSLVKEFMVCTICKGKSAYRYRAPLPSEVPNRIPEIRPFELIQAEKELFKKEQELMKNGKVLKPFGR